MVRRIPRISWIMLVSFLPCVNALSLGLDNELGRATLRGLPGVYVAVEFLKPGIEGDGPTEEELRKEIEAELQRAGIGILTLEGLRKTEGNPQLVVFVAAMKSKGVRGYVCQVSVELHQTAYLARDPGISADVVTWGRETLGTSHALDVIRIKVRELVNQFIETYELAN